MNKIIKVIRIRKKYLLLSYSIGYLFPIIMDGLPSIYYLCPIKTMAISTCFMLGNGLYHAKNERLTLLRSIYISIKYGIPGLSFLCLSLLLQRYIYLHYGIDIGPIIGTRFNR